MYTHKQDEVDIEYKFMMDLILKKDYSVEDAKRTVKELFSEDVSTEEVNNKIKDMYEGSRYMALKQQSYYSAGGVPSDVYLSIDGIDGLEDWDGGSRITYAGARFHVQESVEEIASYMKKYKEYYG